MNKEQVFEKMFKNMSYDTYKKIETGSFFSAFAINFFASFNGQNLSSLQMSSLFSLQFFLSCYYAFTKIFYAEIYTKDIKEIKKMYEELINDYADFIKDFNLYSPVEIFSLYVFMLNNGYLSYTSDFKYGFNNYGDIFAIAGANIVTGKSVCRNISFMLNDIFNKTGIDSQNLTVFVNLKESSKCNIASLISELQLDFETATDPIVKKEILDKIKINIEKFESIKTKPNPILSKIPNHLITLASYNDNCYLFDPTNKNIYIKDKNINDNLSKTYLISSKMGKVKIIDNGIFNHFWKIDRNETKKKLLLSNPNEKDELAMIDKTIELCNENIDIIHNFRNNHIELYEELNNALSKIRKRILQNK